MTDQANRVPGYWRHELSGVLAPVVEKYLTKSKSLTLAEVRILRAYLIQWISAAAWDGNPYLNEEGAGSLKSLRDSARAIRSVADAERWLHDAVELGIDPL